MSEQVPQYTRKDFSSGLEVRWCPGCGNYSILATIQKVMTQIGKKKEDLCFVSGIGCSSRFPYYMSTFGMHTIHGRALAIASGVKTQNPNLTVWVATGDGDALSIGGNHFIHAIRRNIDLKIIIFNNEIYGLTKGQYSPTSKKGLVTKSSPYGTVESPFSPASLAIGAGATFFARTIDADPKHMEEVLMKAQQHKGVAVVEVLQNCVIFNDGVHEIFSDKNSRQETCVYLEDGKPMLFGKDREKGLILDGPEAQPRIVEIASVDQSKLLKHTEHSSSSFLAKLLASFAYPHQPLPLGVFRSHSEESYEMAVSRQIQEVIAKKDRGSMKRFLYSGDVWQVQ